MFIMTKLIKYKEQSKYCKELITKPEIQSFLLLFINRNASQYLLHCTKQEVLVNNKFCSLRESRLRNTKRKDHHKSPTTIIIEE